MFIDSHAHLEMDDFAADRDEVLRRALKAGITHIVTIGTDLPSARKALDLSQKYPFVFATVGFHPHNAEDLNPRDLETLIALAAKPKVIAWGEIGLDFFRRHSTPQNQRKAFEEQLEVAVQVGLPVIIHSRDADDELFRTLHKRRGKQTGVIHCFSGNYDLAMAYVDMGYLISIPGTVTFKNASVTQDVAARIPLESLLVETDAPYLAPVPFRGKRNEPGYVAYTAKKIAELRGIDLQEVARQTSENAKRIFHLPHEYTDHQ